MIKNLVVISDLHAGCRLALCPKRVKLDDGGHYKASSFQNELFNHWQHFWNEYVPMATKKEDFAIIVNGDAIDGVHHNSTTQISHNIEDQLGVARELLEPIINQKRCKDLFVIRGTEVHVGKSGKDEEALARSLNARPNEQGQHSRYEMYLRFGKDEKFLSHFSHHVGTTSSASYESTALFKEIIEMYNESGRWRNEPPDLIVRSHRHRCMSIDLPSEKGSSIVLCTPGWQLKTPFVYRLPSGRAGTPQIGGCVIREGADGMPYAMKYVVKVKRSKEVVI